MNAAAASPAAAVLPLLSAGALGLLAGALMAEGALLLPYWRTLSAAMFYELHPVYGPKLMRFYAPLTIAAPLLATLAAAAAWLFGGQASLYSGIAAGLAWSLVAIYFVYFKAANEAFARRMIAPQMLPQALARWAAWHRLRTVLCVLAFGFALWATAAV